MADRDATERTIVVDVIIPVHNAASTVEEAVQSAMRQVVPKNLSLDFKICVNVCCFDDCSSDSSWEILNKLRESFNRKNNSTESKNTEDCDDNNIHSRLFIKKSPSAVARGAGFARNRAAELSDESLPEKQEDRKSTRLNSSHLA